MWRWMQRGDWHRTGLAWNSHTSEPEKPEWAHLTSVWTWGLSWGTQVEFTVDVWEETAHTSKFSSISSLRNLGFCDEWLHYCSIVVAYCNALNGKLEGVNNSLLCDKFARYKLPQRSVCWWFEQAIANDRVIAPDMFWQINRNKGMQIISAETKLW